MNLDELISKYLDGELTEKEDELLWNSMTSDLNSTECETARFKFDSAVSLQLAMKEDAASIEPPEKLVAETEDMILMRIFSLAPESEIISNRRRRTFIWSAFPMLAAIFAFFMFIFVFEISEIKVNTNRTIKSVQQPFLSEISQIPSERVINKQFSKKYFSHLANESNIKNSSAAYANIVFPMSDNNEFIKISDKVDMTETNLSTGNSLMNFIPQDNINTEENHPELLADISPVSTPITNFNNEIINQTKLLNENTNKLIYNALSKIDNTKFLTLQAMLPVENQSDVEVSSVYGTDFINADINVEQITISHFSQSIAYTVNQNESYGVELGLSRYTYVDKGVVNVEHKIGGISGIESYEGGYDFSIGFPQEISINSEKQLLWGTIFYENSFLKAQDFALTGRIGIGGSSEGAMGYGRIYAEYSLFNGFKITLGTEGRTFNANFSNFNVKEKNFKYSAALLYGIEFKF